jgi:hypothetical protein
VFVMVHTVLQLQLKGRVHVWQKHLPAIAAVSQDDTPYRLELSPVGGHPAGKGYRFAMPPVIPLRVVLIFLEDCAEPARLGACAPVGLQRVAHHSGFHEWLLSTSQ